MATLLEVAAQFKRLFSHIVLPNHNRRIDFTGGCQKVSGGAEKSPALFTGLGEGVSHSRGHPRAGGPDLNSDVPFTAAVSKHTSISTFNFQGARSGGIPPLITARKPVLSLHIPALT